MIGSRSPYRVAAATWLSLVSSACFESHSSEKAAPSEPSPGAPDLAVVAGFEQALRIHCSCRSRLACDDAWNEQFGSTSKTCVAQALEEAQARDCAEQGVRELTACLLGADCTRCNGALLTEDTPLGDLVEKYCPRERASAYVQMLRASGFCAHATSP